jgi:hypothetical protein
MKNTPLLFLIFFSCVFYSCAGIDGVTVMEGLVSIPPLHPLQNTDTNIIRITGEIFSPTNSPMTGRIQRDTNEIYNQIRWSHPRITVLGDIEFFLSRNTASRAAISMGFALGYIGNQPYKMVQLGLAYERNYRIIGVRFDFGFSFARINSERYPYWGDNPYPTSPFSPNSKLSSAQNEGGRYESFTLGIHQPESRWNYNLQIAYSWQKISGRTLLFGSAHDEPPTGAYFLHINPFIGYRLSKKSHIAAGLRMIRATDLENTNEPFVVLPFIQYEFGL